MIFLTSVTNSCVETYISNHVHFEAKAQPANIKKKANNLQNFLTIFLFLIIVGLYLQLLGLINSPKWLAPR